MKIPVCTMIFFSSDLTVVKWRKCTNIYKSSKDFLKLHKTYLYANCYDKENKQYIGRITNNHIFIKK